MSTYNRIFACIYAALLGMLIAKDLGRPFWSSGWDWVVIGDQADMAAVSTLLVWFLTAKDKK